MLVMVRAAAVLAGFQGCPCSWALLATVSAAGAAITNSIGQVAKRRKMCSTEDTQHGRQGVSRKIRGGKTVVLSTV